MCRALGLGTQLGASISTTPTGSLPAQLINQQRLLLSSRLQKALKRKSTRKRLIRYSLIATNAAMLIAVITFVAITSHANHSVAALTATSAVTGPVDGLTSYDIAANVAKITSLPERNAINNQAQSAKVALSVNTTDTNLVAKPQLAATALKSRKDIQNYTAVAGDTVTSIGQKFGVTSDSIRWSNGITGDTVAAGKVLVIPPVNGIVYTVAAGDTIQSIAAKYKANVDQITAFNDAEISGIQTGEQILVPNGQIVPVAVVSRTAGFSFGSFTPTYGNNGYDPGWCTWYVASMISIPSNWGNASTWAYFAALSGWTVSSVPPHAGVIAQTTSGNHVAIVQDVSPDGTQIKYSDMNGIAGFGRVGYSGWVPVTHFEHYIYR